MKPVKVDSRMEMLKLLQNCGQIIFLKISNKVFGRDF